MTNIAFDIANIAFYFCIYIAFGQILTLKRRFFMKEQTIYAFAKGDVTPLCKVKDEVFASYTLGKGVAIIPHDCILYAPCDGKVTSLADTHHAIAIESDNGAEILLHVGIDTVNLRGTFFDAKVKPGKKIKKGDKLIVFEKDKIKYEGYDTTICMAICNTDAYDNIDITDKNTVETDDVIVRLS